MVIGAILDFLFGAVATSALTDAEHNRLGAVARAEGRAFVHVRLASGSVEGVSRGWTGHDVRPRDGGMRFDLYSHTVLETRRREDPLTRRAAAFLPMVEYDIWQLRTPGGVVEIALIPQDVEWFNAAIGRPSSES